MAKRIDIEFSQGALQMGPTGKMAKPMIYKVMPEISPDLIMTTLSIVIFFRLKEGLIKEGVIAGGNIRYPQQ